MRHPVYMYIEPRPHCLFVNHEHKTSTNTATVPNSRIFAYINYINACVRPCDSCVLFYRGL